MADSTTSPWTPSSYLAGWGRFASAAAVWIAAGFNVIPSRGAGDKRPATPFKHLYQHDSVRVTGGDLRAWADGFADVPALLLPSSGSRLGLVIVDIDDPEREAWVRRTFGETPLRVRTGRKGGGIHAYYRVPAGERVIGSTNLIGDAELDAYKTRIDVKGWGGYVVAPGSLHETGVEYAATIPFEELLLDRLLDLPEFDVARYNAEREAGFERRGRRPRSRVTHPGDRPSSWMGAFADAGTLEADAVVTDERGNARVLSELQDGARIFAPEREDKTPSATVFKRGSAQYVYDWSTSERWAIADDCRIDFDGLIASMAQTSHPEDPLTKREIGESGSSESVVAVRGAANSHPDALDDDPRFPSYLDADPPLAGDKDPMKLRLHGLSARVEHVTLSPALDNICEAVTSLEGPAPEGVTFIQSPPGTGKTQIMELAWRDPSVKTALAIVPSISLAHAAAARLGGGAVSYQEQGAEEAPKVVTTIHSLARFEHEDVDLLAIDELSAIIDALCATRSLVERPVESTMRLLALIRRAKRVIIADADLQPWHIAYLAERILDTCRLRLFTHEHQSDQSVTFVGPDYATAQMLAHVEAVDEARKQGEHRTVAVQCDTKASAQQMYRVLAFRYPELSMTCITGDNADEREVQEALAEPDEMIRKHHVIVHNTAIATGVSFNLPIDAVFTFYENRDINPKSIMQMHMRFRRAAKRLIGTGTWNPENRPRLSKDIWRRHKRRNNADTELLRRRLKDAFTMTLDGEYRIDNPHYEQAYFAVAGHEAAAFNDRTAEIHRLARLRATYCATLDALPEGDAAIAVEDFQKQRRDVAQGLKLEHCETVARASPISSKEAEAIEKKHIRTKPEKASLEKHKIEDFYEAEATAELVEYDKRGKTRGALTRLARVRMVLDDHDDELAFIEADKNKGKTLARQRCNFLEAKAVAEMLAEILGIHELPEGTDWITALRSQAFKADEHGAKIWAYLEKHGKAFAALEVSGRLPKEQKGAVKWFNGVMRSMGVKSKREKVGSGSDGAVWTYRYLLDEPCAHGQPCYLRLRSRFASAVARKQWSEAIDALTQAA